MKFIAMEMIKNSVNTVIKGFNLGTKTGYKLLKSLIKFKPTPPIVSNIKENEEVINGEAAKIRWNTCETSRVRD